MPEEVSGLLAALPNKKALPGWMKTAFKGVSGTTVATFLAGLIHVPYLRNQGVNMDDCFGFKPTMGGFGVAITFAVIFAVLMALGYLLREGAEQKLKLWGVVGVALVIGAGLAFACYRMVKDFHPGDSDMNKPAFAVLILSGVASGVVLKPLLHLTRQKFSVEDMTRTMKAVVTLGGLLLLLFAGVVAYGFSFYPLTHHPEAARLWDYKTPVIPSQDIANSQSGTKDHPKVSVIVSILFQASDEYWLRWDDAEGNRTYTQAKRFQKSELGTVVPIIKDTVKMDTVKTETRGWPTHISGGPNGDV